MDIKPINDRIVVLQESKETFTSSGLVLPDSAQEKPQRGTVVATGPGKILDNGKKIPMEIKVGDVVLYGKWSGTEVKVKGVDYVMMRQEDVLAIVEGGIKTSAKTSAKAVVNKPAKEKKENKKSGKKEKVKAGKKGK